MKKIYPVITKTAAILILLCAFLPVSSCGPERAGKLREQTRKFAADLRWQRVELSKTHLDAKLLREFGPDLDAVGKKLIITDTEIKHFVLDEEQKKAVVSITFSWYVLPDVGLVVSNEIQTWEEKDGKWILTGAKGKLFPAITKAAAAMRKKAEDELSGTGQEKKSIPKVYQRKPDI